jgi:hypothetical protein
MKTDLGAKLKQYQAALQTFLARIGQDRNIVAAVLVGSLSDATIWRKESIYVWLIEVDGVSKRLKADGKNEDISRTLVEDGINIHAEIIPRSRFRQMVEGSSRTAFSCNFFAKRELVHCSDPSIRSWFEQANTAATKDREKELLATTTWVIHGVRYSRKLLEVKQDIELAKQSVIWTAHSVAALEIVRQGKVYEEEAIYYALQRNPKLLKAIYVDVLAKKASKKLLASAIAAVTEYLSDQWLENLKPLLQYFKKQRRVVPLTELSEHFAYSQLHPWHLESACEWMEQNGFLEKLSAPFKLTTKSRVDVEEPAYLLLE